jgi:hypothetical protein
MIGLVREIFKKCEKNFLYIFQDASLVASSSDDGTIKIWCLQTGDS